MQDVLGYKKFAAEGGDWERAAITSQSSGINTRSI